MESDGKKESLPWHQSIDIEAGEVASKSECMVASRQQQKARKRLGLGMHIFLFFSFFCV